MLPCWAGDGYTEAARALKEMGADAEKAVLGQLRSRDPEVRYRACQILGEIGGATSYQSLNRLLRTDREGLVQNAARTAMFQIQSRHRKR